MLATESRYHLASDNNNNNSNIHEGKKKRKELTLERISRCTLLSHRRRSVDPFSTYFLASNRTLKSDWPPANYGKKRESIRMCSSQIFHSFYCCH